MININLSNQIKSKIKSNQKHIYIAPYVASKSEAHNLPAILHRLRDIAFKMSKIAIFGYPLAFKPPTEGFPWDDLRKIFSECQRMATVPNGEKTLPHERYRIQTDGRQTTDGRATAYSECEREFTFAKMTLKIMTKV